ncbi:ribonucleoprotein PTB-binding 2 isoform X4 [Cavia porcellus]|uniref:ribonucleoprotein PTB-binding 2 isoform X4 n=1 Tax=Cavia porcellus TaxID=10141 RepID=UPI002FE003C0
MAAAGAGSESSECSAGSGGPGARALAAEEVRARLQRMRRALGNRRKILVRNLPRGCGCQEVHDLLKDYELKYCYVDRNKRTAFVTLLDGDQARSAIRTFHQASFRGRDLVVQLQPTDALLCVTRLPQSLTLEEFEALVRTYGSIERCFLVYSEVTGLSKGYGFVEYMKKDAAARARLELLGKRLGPSALFAQWMDVNLLASERVHSRCLCVDQLPANYSDSGELLRCFSGVHTPVFCQLAQDEGRCAGGFAVVEYSSAQHAEEARQAASGLSIGGHTVQVSFCAPGAPGRSTLAALIAGQRSVQSGQKGLLPEPSPVQIMKGLSNPATLQVLLQPRQSTCAAKPVVLGGPPSLSQLISPPVTPTFLHLNQAHQSSLLPRVPSMSLAKLPLLKLEGIRTNNKPGLLGEPPALVLQTALGVGLALPLRREPGHPGETPKSKSLSLVPTPATLAAALGLLPFFPSQCSVGQAGPGLESVQEKHLATVGVIEGGLSGPQPCLQSFASLAARGLQAVQPRQPPQKQPAGAASEPLLLSADAFEKEAASQTQTSLLGEPPREIRLSRNPYLNLASVLPGVCLASAAGQVTLQTPGLVSTILDKCAPSCPPFGDSAQSSCWSRAQVAMHFDDHTSGAGFEAISSHRPESHRGLIRNPADTGAQAMCWQPAQPTPTFRSAESKDKGAAQTGHPCVVLFRLASYRCVPRAPALLWLGVPSPVYSALLWRASASHLLLRPPSSVLPGVPPADGEAQLGLSAPQP